MMLYLAAEKPGSAAEIVTQRIAAEAAQTEKLYGFQFRLNAVATIDRDVQNLQAELAMEGAAVESS